MDQVNAAYIACIRSASSLVSQNTEVQLPDEQNHNDLFPIISHLGITSYTQNKTQEAQDA